MNILFLSRLFYPHIGGVEKHILEISKRLQKKGHKVTIVTTRYDKTLPEMEIVLGIKIMRFDQPQVKLVGLIKTWVWMVKNISLFKKTDIVHVHDVFIWYWPLKLLIPFKKVFLTIHGQWGKYPISLNDKMQKKLGVLLTNANLCIGSYIPKHYGLNATAISYGGVNMPKINNFTKINNKILYIGRLDDELPIKRYIEVFKKLNGFDIDIYGDGNLRTELMKVGNIKGFADPSRVYKNTKIVFASGYLTILEALANKCLVVVSFCNDLQKDYYELTPFKKYLILEGDLDKLVRRLKYFYKKSKSMDDLIESGYEWVKTQSWEDVSKLYIKLWT